MVHPSTCCMGDIALTIGVALGTAAIGLLTGRTVLIIATRFCPQPGLPYATEITTAAVFGLLGWKIGLDPLLRRTSTRPAPESRSA